MLENHLDVSRSVASIYGTHIGWWVQSDLQSIFVVESG